MKITITIPEELREFLDNDDNLSISEINVVENTIILYDKRSNRYDYWNTEDIEFEIVVSDE